MDLPLDKRYEIIFLCEHPKGPKLSITNMAIYIGCSRPTVIYWTQKYRQNSDLNTQPKSDRNRITISIQDKKIVELAKKKYNITSTEIQQKLKKEHVEISARTIRRRLVESGGKFINEISKSLLTEKHRIKRLEWAKKNQNFDWNRVIFSDESTFQLYT